MTIEAFAPMWFIAFTSDFALGCICFYLVFTKMITDKFRALGWWVGWWSFAGAFAIVLNAYMGTDYFWSYHQTGIVTDTATNIGLIGYLAWFMKNNWAMTDTDWEKVYKIRDDAKIRELSE